MKEHTIFDWSRQARTGVPEVVYAESKSIDQLRDILKAHEEREEPLLLTRLTPGQIEALAHARLDIDPAARTAVYASPLKRAWETAVVAALPHRL